MLTIFFTIIALLFGSFTNVLIYRCPQDLSILKPGSFCPECKTPISWLSKLPLLSYVLLGGKCKTCKTQISFLYPLVEILVPVLSFKFISEAAENAALIQKLSSSMQEQFLDQALNFVDFLFSVTLISITVALAVIDQKHKILPHLLTYSGILIGIVFVSIFGTSYYESSEIFSNIADGYLTSFFSSLMQLGIVFFSLDALTHFANKIYYKEKGLSIASSGLTFGIRFLEEKITLVYLLLIILVLSLLMNFQDFYLHYLFALLGASYLINEILRDFFFQNLFKNLPDTRLASAEQAELTDVSMMTAKGERNEVAGDLGKGFTVLGGGDVAMIAMISVIFGLSKTLLIVLIGFYLLFVFLMFKFIKIFYQAAFDKGTEEKPSGMELLKANLARHIPLGGALAVSFIAAMMFFS